MGECFNYSHVLQIRVGKEKRESGNQCGQSYHKHKKPAMKSFTVAIKKGLNASLTSITLRNCGGHCQEED